VGKMFVPASAIRHAWKHHYYNLQPPSVIDILTNRNKVIGLLRKENNHKGSRHPSMIGIPLEYNLLI